MPDGARITMEICRITLHVCCVGIAQSKDRHDQVNESGIPVAHMTKPNHNIKVIMINLLSRLNGLLFSFDYDFFLWGQLE